VTRCLFEHGAPQDLRGEYFPKLAPQARKRPARKRAFSGIHRLLRHGGPVRPPPLHSADV